MRKFVYVIIIFISSNLFALDNLDNKVDCLILQDENSIVCKYILKSVDYNKTVIITWIEPNGKITRSKEIIIPAGHFSAYDYRYIEGRALGTWIFKVIDDSEEYQTIFTIE
jgi:hypothetical protein